MKLTDAMNGAAQKGFDRSSNQVQNYLVLHQYTISEVNALHE